MTDWNQISQNLSSRLGPELDRETGGGEEGSSFSGLNKHSWRPESVERRMGLVHNNLQVDNNSAVPQPSEVPQKIAQEPTVEQDDQPKVVMAEPGLEDLVEFDSNGEEIKKEPSNKRLSDFEPVESVDQKRPESKTVKPDISLGNNRDIVEKALGTGDVKLKNKIGSGNPLAQLEQPSNKLNPQVVNASDGGGLGEFDKMKGEADVKAEPAPIEPVAEDRTPIVTVDPTPVSAEVLPEQREPNAELAKDQKAAKQTLPPAIAEDANTEKPEPVLGEHEVPITYQPSGEQRIAEGRTSADNGVDQRVAEIQARMKEGDAKFDKEVDHEHGAESAIAPAPEMPGTQTQGDTEPEVQVDQIEGQPAQRGGIIGEIKPKAEDMARSVKGDETSGYFARLLAERERKKKAA